MDYVLALGALMLMGCLVYYIPRLIAPDIAKVWGGLILLIVSTGCLVFFLGVVYIGEVQYPFSGVLETVRALWDGFLYSIADLRSIFDAGKVTWALSLVLASLLLNTFASAAIGSSVCYSLEESGWLVVSMIAAVFVVVLAWLALLICELILFLIIGIAEEIYRMVCDGTFGAFFSILLFFGVLLGGAAPVAGIIVVIVGD